MFFIHVISVWSVRIVALLRLQVHNFNFESKMTVFFPFEQMSEMNTQIKTMADSREQTESKHTRLRDDNQHLRERFTVSYVLQLRI